MSRALERFAAPVRNETGTLTVPLPEGERQLAELVRALDQAGLRIAALQLHQPTLDDVFLATTGRKLEGAGSPATQPEGRGRRRRHGR